MTRDVLIVANPTARNGETADLIPVVVEILRSHGWTVDVTVTRSAEHAVEVAAGAREGQLLAALGGDGLLARVAEGALRSGAVVAPLPGGRGCDFIRALGSPGGLREAATALRSATERRVDVGFAGDTPFLGVATVGYDSLANDYANGAPGWMPASLVYAYGGLRALVETRTESITITTDGRSRTFAGWSVAIGNSGRYGAGMRVNPDASLTDGELDITTVESLSRAWFPVMLPRYFKGTHIDGDRIRADRGREIAVSAPVGYRVFADGDDVGRTPMTFTVEPGALRILV